MSTTPLSLRAVRTLRPTTLIARISAGFLLLVTLVLSLTPWQQTALAHGKVVGYSPEDRLQNIEAPIEGRVTKWYVSEGTHVEPGDPIVDLTDNDPDLLRRMRLERDAIAARVEAARARAVAIESRLDALDGSRDNATVAASSRAKMAADRVRAANQAVELAKSTLRTAELNLERQKKLEEQGIASRRQLELAELDEAKGRTELERARAAFDAARTEQLALTSDRDKVSTDADASIRDAQASRAAAEAEVAIASAELTRMEVRLARQETQSVKATRKGTVLRISSNTSAANMVKAGDILVTIVPETDARAVEVWIDGNDAPLVRNGTQARIQFEGWPALQFSGWPGVAVGTFPGKVILVDAAEDNGGGKFRALVVPEHPGEWPSTTYLRQGVRVNAWAQLGRVKLGYELWRLFNGFPPSLPKAPTDDDKADGGKAGAKK